MAGENIQKLQEDLLEISLGGSSSFSLSKQTSADLMGILNAGNIETGTLNNLELHSIRTLLHDAESKEQGELDAAVDEISSTKENLSNVLNNPEMEYSFENLYTELPFLGYEYLKSAAIKEDLRETYHISETVQNYLNSMGIVSDKQMERLFSNPKAVSAVKVILNLVGVDHISMKLQESRDFRVEANFGYIGSPGVGEIVSKYGTEDNGDSIGAPGEPTEDGDGSNGGGSNGTGSEGRDDGYDIGDYEQESFLRSLRPEDENDYYFNYTEVNQGDANQGQRNERATHHEDGSEYIDFEEAPEGENSAGDESADGGFTDWEDVTDGDPNANEEADGTTYIDFEEDEVLPLNEWSDEEIINRYFTYGAQRHSNARPDRNEETLGGILEFMRSLTASQLEEYEVMANGILNIYIDRMDEMGIPVSPFGFDMTRVYRHLAKEQSYTGGFNEQNNLEQYPLRDIFDEDENSTAEMVNHIIDTMVGRDLCYATLHAEGFEIATLPYLDDERIGGFIENTLGTFTRNFRDIHSYEFRDIGENIFRLYDTYANQEMSTHMILNGIDEMGENLRNQFADYNLYMNNADQENRNIFRSTRRRAENRQERAEMSGIGNLRYRWGLRMENLGHRRNSFLSARRRNTAERGLNTIDEGIFQGVGWQLFDDQDIVENFGDDDLGTRLGFANFSTSIHPRGGIDVIYSMTDEPGIMHHPQITEDHNQAHRFDIFLYDLIHDEHLNTAQRLFLIKQTTQSHANQLIQHHGTLSSVGGHLDMINGELTFRYRGNVITMSQVDVILERGDEAEMRGLIPNIMQMYEQFWLMCNQKQQDIQQASNRRNQIRLLPHHAGNRLVEQEVNIGTEEEPNTIRGYELPDREHETLGAYRIGEDGDTQYRVIGGFIQMMTPHRESDTLYYRSRRTITLQDIGIQNPEWFENYVRRTFELFFAQYRERRPHIVTEHHGQLLEIYGETVDGVMTLRGNYLGRNGEARTGNNDIMGNLRRTRGVHIAPHRNPDPISLFSRAFNPIRNWFDRRGFRQNARTYSRPNFDLNRVEIQTQEELGYKLRDVDFASKAIQAISAWNRQNR